MKSLFIFIVGFACGHYYKPHTPLFSAPVAKPTPAHIQSNWGSPLDEPAKKTRYSISR